MLGSYTWVFTVPAKNTLRILVYHNIHVGGLDESTLMACIAGVFFRCLNVSACVTTMMNSKSQEVGPYLLLLP